MDLDVDALLTAAIQECEDLLNKSESEKKITNAKHTEVDQKAGITDEDAQVVPSKPVSNTPTKPIQPWKAQCIV